MIPGLFRLLPRFNYRHYEQCKDKYGSIHEVFADKKQPGYTIMSNFREANVESGIMLKDMYNEVNDNYGILQRNNGRSLKFANSVQFLHLESQRFLSFVPTKSSVFEPECLAIELADEYSPLSIFKLLPVFNYQTDIAEIKGGDDIHIRSFTDEASSRQEFYLGVAKSAQPKVHGKQRSKSRHSRNRKRASSQARAGNDDGGFI